MLRHLTKAQQLFSVPRCQGELRTPWLHAYSISNMGSVLFNHITPDCMRLLKMSASPSSISDVCCAMQAFTLWLQYISLLGNTNVPAPKTISWVFSASGFAFSSITSGTLSTDCLISPYGINPALKRLILRLAVPWITLVILLVSQVLR